MNRIAGRSNPIRLAGSRRDLLARFLRCILLLYAGCFSVLTPTASGEEVGGFVSLIPPAPAFNFADPQPLTVTPSSFPVRIQILNQTMEPLTLETRLDASSALPPAGEVATPPQVFMLRPPTLELPAADSAHIELGLVMPAKDLPEGESRLFVVAFSRQTEKMVRKEIRLSVANRPVPLVSKWDLHYWRCLPFSRRFKPRQPGGAYLPLLKAGDPPQKPEIVGYLLSDQRDEAVVSWELAEEKLASGLDGARISLAGIDSYTAKYEGTVDFQPGTEGGEVTLRVLIKDYWIWPVLALLLGFCLTSRIQSYLAGGRSIKLQQKREADLGIALGQALAQFEHKAHDTQFNCFRLNLEAARQEVRASLKQLAKQQTTNLEDHTDFKAAQKELARLEEMVDSWPGFLDELKELAEAKELWKAALSIPPLHTEEAPKCLQKVPALISPNTLSATEYEQRKLAVVLHTKILNLWPKVEGRLAKQLQLIEDLEKAMPNGRNRERLEAVKQENLATQGRLWRLETLEELEQQDAALDFSADELNRLRSYRVEGDTHHALQDAQDQREDGIPIDWQAAKRGLERFSEDRRRAASYTTSLQINDHLALGFALLVAITTGLSQLYHGQDFVTRWHYLSAVVWGASSKITVDTILAGIGQLATSLKALGR